MADTERPTDGEEAAAPVAATLSTASAQPVDRTRTETECFGFDSDSDAEEVEGLSFGKRESDGVKPKKDEKNNRRLSDLFEHDFDMINNRILSVMDEIAEDLNAGPDPVSDGRRRSSIDSRRRSSLGMSAAGLEALQALPINGDAASTESAAVPFSARGGKSPRTMKPRASLVQFEESAMSTLLSIQNQLLELQSENADLREQVAGLEGDRESSKADLKSSTPTFGGSGDGAAAVDSLASPEVRPSAPALNFAPADRGSTNADDKGTTEDGQSSAATVDKDAILKLAQTLPVDGGEQFVKSPRSAREKSARTPRRGDGGEDVLGDADHPKSSRMALRNQLEAQRLQLRAERAHRRTLEDENKELTMKLQKCEKVVKRLTKELEDITKRGPPRGSEASVSSAAALWRPNANRSNSNLESVEIDDKASRVSSNLEKWRTASKQEEAKKDQILSTFNQAISSFFGGLASTVQEEAEEVAPLCWLAGIKSTHVALSEDCRTATYTASDKAALHSYVCTAESPQLEDGYGFEVRVTKVKTGDDDGLAIGFTSTPPAEWPRDLPETADMLPGGVWLVGYDGQFWSASPDKEEGEWVKSKFHPAKLHVGDRVTVQVSFEGRFEVAINEKLAWATNIPMFEDVPLYGVVDLLGNTQEVALIDEVLVAEE